MGAKGRQERRSERKATAARANARRPRGRWANTAERERLEEAKATLRDGLPDGARLVVALLRDPASPPELRLQAFRIAADRAGLPTLAQSEVTVQEQPSPLRIVIEPGAATPSEPLPADVAPEVSAAPSPLESPSTPDPPEPEPRTTKPTRREPPAVTLSMDHPPDPQSVVRRRLRLRPYWVRVGGDRMMESDLDAG
jgi:hypothetical protein